MMTVPDSSPLDLEAAAMSSPINERHMPYSSSGDLRGYAMRSSMELAMAATGTAQDTFVQSLSYKCRTGGGSLTADKRSFSARRMSTVSTTTGSSFSPEDDPAQVRMLPSSLSYSVPSVSVVSNTPRGRPAVDVIATYMNTTDPRSVKTDLLRSHAHFASPRTSPLPY
jgi:hypothetical protein